MSRDPAPSARAARSRRIVVDASVVLAFYLPAEPYKAQALMLAEAAAGGHVALCAPTLLRYEVLNALALVMRGVRQAQKISLQDAQDILDGVGALQLEEYDVAGLEPRVLALANGYGCSAYDASYLALAEHLRADLLTGDLVFHRSMRDHFPQVKRVQDFGSEG